MTATGKCLLGGSALLLAAANLTVATAPSRGDEPVLHHVTYTVTAANPIYADIHYLDQEPTLFSDYSHNPYQFVPNIQADIAPGHPWTSPDVTLADPNQWAMVTASTGHEPGTPMFHCQLAVDGTVVVSNDGPKGVLCSLRSW